MGVTDRLLPRSCECQPRTPTSVRYQVDTIAGMAMTLRLSDEEQELLRRRAAEEGVSMQEVARRAVREYVGIQDHRDRVFASARSVLNAHADAIERLGR